MVTVTLLKGSKMAGEKEKESSQSLDNLPFTKVFQTFRIAIQPSKLIIALMAVVVLCITGWIMDYVVIAASDAPSEAGTFSSLWDAVGTGFHGAVYSLLLLDISGVATSIAECFEAIGQAIQDHYIYSIIYIVIALVVASLAGGAICRIAALQFARGEKPGLGEALNFSTKRFVSLFAAPLTPLGIIVFMGLFIFVLGLIGNIPWAGELLVGICMPLTLLAGGLMAVVLIGAVAGFNLMFPAVGYDDADCFDAISRAFSYIYAKPWRMGFYTALAAVYGAICYSFVRFFAFLLLWVSHRTLQLGILGDNSKLKTIWPQPSFVDFFGGPSSVPSIWTESVAAFLVYIFVLVTVGLVISFVVSFYFSANTVIYALMRNKVDNTAVEDVYTYPEETKTEPTTPESKPEETKTPPESEKQPD
jgi:hypothetical protein